MKTYFWDIETSKVKADNGEKIQVTFLSNILDYNLETCEYTSHFFRTIEETREFMHNLEEGIVFSHNLDYELSFLTRDMEKVEFVPRLDKQGNKMYGVYGEQLNTSIFRSKHSPLSIQYTEFPQLTFKDSLALFGKGVKMLGKELEKRGEELPKLPYNYEKIRLPWHELEQLDYDYNERDNLIVATSLYYYMQDNNITDVTKLPLTFTGAIRKQRKEFILEHFGKKELRSYDFEYKKRLQEYNFFNLCTRVYQGGLTTSSKKHTGKFIDKPVYSIDIKSSYPFQMCTNYFPCFNITNTNYYKGKSANENYKKFKWFMGSFKFINIRVKNDDYLLPISSSQLSKHANNFREQNIKTFNGKMISADVILLHANNIDLDVIKRCYHFDSVICEEVYTTPNSRTLRESEVAFLLHCFNIKENTPKDTFDYNQSKSAINGQYGIKVTSPIRSAFLTENNELRELDYYSLIDSDKRKEEIFNNFANHESFNNMDIYTDGLYITSYARKQLVFKMCELVDKGCTVLYSDTDSIKFYTDNIEVILKDLERENEYRIKSNLRLYRFRQYKERFNVDDTTMRKLAKMGIWDIENKDNPYTLFVTYGAKKYGYIDNKGMHITVAGCNKHKPIEAMKKFSEKNEIPLDETMKLIFAPGTCFDIGVSGRTTSYYETRDKEELEYFMIEGRRIGQYGGMIIEDTTYTLNITKSDSLILGKEFNDEIILTINEEGDIY